MSRFLLAVLSVGVVTTAAWLARSTDELARAPAAVAELRAFGPVQPRLSPAGNRVVFSYQAALWVMPATGGAMTRLTSGDGFDTEPVWSPDGKRIAYLNGREFGSGRVSMIQAADGAPIEVPGALQASGKLAFHPDGRRILGNLRTADLRGGEGLAWLNLKTGKVTTVTDPPRPAQKAALSTDGRWIAFATHQDVPGQQGGNDGPQADLWKVPAEGGKPEKIVQLPARVYDLCWAADGRSLFLVTDQGGAHNDLWQVPLDDPLRGARQLTSGQADEDRPSLSRDGRWLLYTDNREGATALVRRALRTGGEQTLAMTDLDFRRPTGSLKLLTVDKGSGKPVVARFFVVEAGGKFHAPPGALYRLLGGNGYFYCREAAEFRLPAGEYRLIVARGPEYRAVRKSLRIEEGKSTEATVELERWVDAASSHLYSGENHIHANYGYGEWYNTPESMLLQCEGEDLNVCNFMVANSDGDGVFDRSFFRGRPDPLSTPGTILYWNEEYRSTIWGHMTLVNLRQVVEPVFTGFKDTTNPYDVPTNADISERTRQQGGLVNYTHSASNVADPYLGPYSGKGLPVDVALGAVDTMDLNLNFNACVPLWYRHLNCGFRLPASAGTDVFLNRIASIVPGWARAYVYLDGELSYAKWIDGLRAGRCFVTNGPFVELIADQKRPGEVIKLAGPDKIKVKARAWSHLPMQRAELVQNGRVVATREFPADGKQEVTWEQEVSFGRSGWLALRASGPSHADNPGGPAYAHTSAIYVEVAGRPQEARADAQYFLKWIDRLEIALRERNRFPRAAQRDHALAQLEQARKVYVKLMGR